MKNTVQGFSAPLVVGMITRYFKVGEELYVKYNKHNIDQYDPIDIMSDLAVSNMNLAFCCEIGLKLLVYAETKQSNFTKHDLQDLFNALSNTSQVVIRSFTLMYINSFISNQPNKTDDDFIQDLEMNKDAFIKSRYWYEQAEAAEKYMGNQFIFSFAKAIKEYIEQFPFKNGMVWITINS